MGPPHLGHLAGTQDTASGLGAEQQHRHAGGLLAQLPHHLYQHLREEDRAIYPSPDARAGLGLPQAPGSHPPALTPPPRPSQGLTERDSTETVSTIRGPSECRFNSSWDFSAACGAGRAAEGSGTDILLLNRDLSSSPFLPMLSVNRGGRALPGLTCFPGFHL